MPAYAIVDVEVLEIDDFLRYQKKVAPLLERVGGRYLARGGESRVYVGDYEPGRIILLEFPNLEVMDDFYHSDAYRSLVPERDACSNCHIIAVQGLT